MTVQLWKRRGSSEARVTFRCPWCDVIGSSVPRGHYASRDAFWLLASCTEPMCDRGVLISVAREGRDWADMETGDDGVFLDRRSLHPSSAPDYDADGVPPDIATAMAEALRCRASGLNLAATLAARHALGRAVAAFGGRGRTALDAIESLSADALDTALRRHAAQVALLSGSDAAIATPAGADVDRLLVYAEEVLHNLYVVPARLQRYIQQR